MKNIIFILLVFTIIGCKQSHHRDNLIGTWDWVSSTDIETGEVELYDGDDSEFVEFKSDSLYLIPDKVFAWRIEGDSIFLDDDYLSVYIKELSNNALIVEFVLWGGKEQMTLKKRKQ